VIAVAHRLSTLAEFDRVIVLHEGRIVEDGPPRELARAGGIYASMLSLQANGFRTTTLEVAA
jgi:ATP-binding cassette subfamily B protein